MRPAVLVYNPKSGRQNARRLLPKVLEVLRTGGFDVAPRPTVGPGDATRLARDAREEAAEVVFALGGDGTVREVAAGLLGSDTILGILPAGTANVLARAFSLPSEPRAAARALRAAEPREIDVGLVGETPFLMMASCGLDAMVIRQQSPGLKKVLGPAAVALTTLEHWWTYTYPEIELRFAGREERATLAVVANIPYYGGPFRIAPDADVRDRRLDLVLFRGRGRAAALAFGCDLALGQHMRRSDVETVQVEEVEILGPPGLAAQIDGDALSAGPPLRIALASERLRVLLP